MTEKEMIEQEKRKANDGCLQLILCLMMLGAFAWVMIDFSKQGKQKRDSINQRFERIEKHLGLEKDQK